MTETHINKQKTKILFVGEIHSSHAVSWISLLDPNEYEIRCFDIGPSHPPENFPHLTYITSASEDVRQKKEFVYPPGLLKLARKLPLIRKNPNVVFFAQRWLAKIIRRWQPDIIHTFGLVAGAEFLFSAKEKCGLKDLNHLVVQLRGGSDLFFNHLDASIVPRLANVISAADGIVTDNELNFEYFEKMGVDVSAKDRLIISGTGGVDVETLASGWQKPPSLRRNILWPKGYVSPWASGLSTLEGLIIAIREIRPDRVDILWAVNEIPPWVERLPADIRALIRLHDMVSRDDVFSMMQNARVVLLPSLVDGVPNSMWESMACGAVPIVSPLPTITPQVSEPENVFFAENLYPHEIAEKIVLAMTDDPLVDQMATTNLDLVRKASNRCENKKKLDSFYKTLLTPFQERVLENVDDIETRARV